MADLFVISLALFLICGGAVYLMGRRLWGARIQALETEVRQLSEAVCQMAEMQVNAYHKISGSLGDVEERLLNLAIPSQDPTSSLDKRHQVLTLAKKGIALDEIVKRLRVPRGEAELILSLRKYTDTVGPIARRAQGELASHVQA